MEDRVQDKFVKLNGLQFHYREWGNKDAPALNLLHGITSHARSWDTTARAMQDRYRVLALDQRGHGEAEWAKEYRPELMIDDIADFVDALGLKKISLIGHSMGGHHALAVAAQNPEIVERLVIVDYGPEIMPEFIKVLDASTQATDVFADPEDRFRILRAGNPRPTDDELRHRVIHSLKQRDDGKWTFRMDTALRKPGALGHVLFDSRFQWSLLPKITCPTLLVRGSISNLLASETAERMSRTIPNCKLVEVPNAGHSVPLDNPEGFIAALQEFL